MKRYELKLGAETLLQERFLSENKGALLFFQPGIEVAHYILPQKMSLTYHSRRLMKSGAAASSYEVRSASLSFEVGVRLPIYVYRHFARYFATGAGILTGKIMHMRKSSHG